VQVSCLNKGWAEQRHLSHIPNSAHKWCTKVAYITVQAANPHAPSTLHGRKTGEGKGDGMYKTMTGQPVTGNASCTLNAGGG
jgi:hypothetical protein